ncbi:hypothetical protein JNJ66_03760 [Candidatus Saccharibacteria bacterium]|nr:hypothetical protein [Candidatus Saccharibacteria bacterium]
MSMTLRRFVRAGVLLVLSVVVGAVGSVPPVQALTHGDGMLVYGEGTQTVPRFRLWDEVGSAWGAESSGTTAAASMRHVVNRASPVRNEIIAGYQTTGGVLYIQRWNGFAWTAEWNVTIGNGNLPRFDIAYEQSSGEAVVLYSTNTATNNELAYRVWNGSAWTAATTMSSARTAGTVDAVKMASRSGSNDLAAAWGDTAFDLSANYWNGATNLWQTEPTAALSTNLSKVGTATTLTNRSFDLTFESLSGELMIVWGNDAVLDLVYATRGAGAGGAWTAAVTNTAFAEEPTDVELAAEPGTDYIGYAASTDNGADADAGIWTGSAWGNLRNYDQTIGTVGAGTNNNSAEWVQSGGQSRLVISYEDSNAVGVDWVFFNKNTGAWTTATTDFTTTPRPATGDDKLHRMQGNPHDRSELMLTIIDSAGDLFVKRLNFDGTNLTWSNTEGAAALETTISSTTGFAANFAYNAYIPSGSLGMNIVDGSGAGIASPGIVMPAKTLSLDCQTSTGSLGTASQRIRITNNTGTPTWTASVAATAGSSALWTSSSDQYDFNDGAGSPAGCGAGSDGDTKAGRLSVNASASVLTPQTNCTTDGITKGAAASFNENVTDSVTLLTADTTAMYECYWDLTGVALDQTIPPQQSTGTYNFNLTVTVVAN